MSNKRSFNTPLTTNKEHSSEESSLESSSIEDYYSDISDQQSESIYLSNSWLNTKDTSLLTNSPSIYSESLTQINASNYLNIAEQRKLGSFQYLSPQPSQLDKPIQLLGIPQLDDQLPSSGLSKGNIIEIVGKSGGGKSKFMYQTIAKTILPNYWTPIQLTNKSPINSIHIGGSGAAVILYDCNLKFEIVVLFKILSVKVIQALKAAGIDVSKNTFPATKRQKFADEKPAINFNLVINLVELCLNQVKIIKPSSMDHLHHSITSLSPYDIPIGIHHHPVELTPLASPLIIINSLAHFYWHQKLGTMTSPNHLFNQQKLFVKSLNIVSNKLKAVVIATSWILFDGGPNNSEIMSSAWTERVNFKIEVESKVNENGFNLKMIKPKGIVTTWKPDWIAQSANQV